MDRIRFSEYENAGEVIDSIDKKIQRICHQRWWSRDESRNYFNHSHEDIENSRYEKCPKRIVRFFHRIICDLKHPRCERILLRIFLLFWNPCGRDHFFHNRGGGFSWDLHLHFSGVLLQHLSAVLYHHNIYLALSSLILLWEFTEIFWWLWGVFSGERD